MSADKKECCCDDCNRTPIKYAKIPFTGISGKTWLVTDWYCAEHWKDYMKELRIERLMNIYRLQFENYYFKFSKIKLNHVANYIFYWKTQYPKYFFMAGEDVKIIEEKLLRCDWPK